MTEETISMSFKVSTMKKLKLFIESSDKVVNIQPCIDDDQIKYLCNLAEEKGLIWKLVGSGNLNFCK